MEDFNRKEQGLSSVLSDLDQTTLLEILEADGYDERILRLLSEAITKLVRKSPILAEVIGHHEQ